ncbi:hypothetical protein GF357_03570 [Candidatus Dojkabacteria bacterium]|nr:hypothetical protein [Candidatus Dojkabacteria bacterium]
MFNKCMAVGIKVTDFAKAFNFYTKILRLTVKTEDRKNKFAELSVGDLTIALLTEETLDEMCGKKAFQSNSMSNHLFAIEVDDVEQTYNHLKETVEFIKKPGTTPWGQKVAYFKDIESYIWEISEPFEE